MEQQTKLRKLLVLRGPSTAGEGALSFLKDLFEVHFVSELDGALKAMREAHFDAVLAETADFLPLERGIVSQQAGLVLDTLGDGVCIVGPGGELVWGNRRLREMPPEVLASLRDVCVRAYEAFATDRTSARGRRFSITPDDGNYFDVICSPVRDAEGLLRQVVAVVVDSTTQRRQQLKLNALDAVGRELVSLGDEDMRKADAQERLGLLESRIIRSSQEVLDYQHFAVLLVDERRSRLDMLFSQGLDGDQPDVPVSAEGAGICGYVAATGRSYICPDIRRDSRYVPGLSTARSSLTVPLRLHDRVIGVLNVESDAVGAFNEEDRQFAEIFANYVAMALHVLNLLVYERHNAHTQVTDLVCADLSGPLNDIVTEASELLEDYIGHDDLRARLRSIIDLASTARKKVQQIQQAPRSGVLSAGAGPGSYDPVLAGRRVLVVDDEELIRTTIHDVLEPCGCEVQVASNGSEAIGMIGQTCFDLVISDIKMPGATGYEVFAAAKAACGETEVILITGFGYDPHHSIVRANREGLAAVLMKPFKVKELLDQCRAAIK
jgi:CheY-like chemotaxis protein/GAF domain-containing protein